MVGNVIMNGGGERRDAGEDTAAQTLGGNVSEEALDHVQPGRRSGREVNMETRVFLQPFFDLGVLVGCVVVTHQMQCLLPGRFPVDLLQEIEPLDVAMTLLAGSDDLAIQGAQGSEQRGRAMALIVMGHGRGPALFQRQPGLGAVQRLNLALFVAAQHQRVLWHYESLH